MDFPIARAVKLSGIVFAMNLTATLANDIIRQATVDRGGKYGRELRKAILWI
jgi:hypothetical protein